MKAKSIGKKFDDNKSDILDAFDLKTLCPSTPLVYLSGLRVTG